MVKTLRQWIISLLIFVFLLASMAFVDASQAAPSQSGQSLVEIELSTITSKIETELVSAISENGSADFILRFTEQADLSPAFSMDWEARGKFVYNTLRETAANSQVRAKAILDAAGLNYQTFIAGNELYVWSGILSNVYDLAALPEVLFIRATRIYMIDPLLESKPFENITWAGDLIATNSLTTVGSSPASIVWGITDSKADQFWTMFGVQGDGIVVANIDTGVDYTHVALDQSYKCLADPSSPVCWLDPGRADCSGVDGGPCDTKYITVYHGTHTMGTMIGDDDPSLANQVGMAPNAQWIACLGCPKGSCPDLDLNTCADWILAPNGDPANRPDVVNNSWGGGGGDNWYLAKVQAWIAAGIFPAFSAGNDGPGCSTIGSPGDYQESFASAAHDSSRTIASFSSRGPSDFGHTPYTKPNISAPGVDVLSTKPGDQWTLMSGTSMASPHTAGAVALLWSCNPALIGQVDTTFQLLQDHANSPPAGTCGAPPDSEGNYTFGYGYLDVLAAGKASCAPTAVILVDFSARSTPQGIQLNWETANEIDLVGFNLYRSDAPDGERMQLNQSLILGINPGQLKGNEYHFLDMAVNAGHLYYYWIEWVASDLTEFYGPTYTSFSPYWIWLASIMR